MTFIYARVSSKEQMAGGVSLEAQVEKCLAYSAAHGLVMSPHSNCGRDGVFVDGGVSSTKKKGFGDRPGGSALLKVLQKGDILICTSPHRMFRSLLAMLKQIEEWEKLGVDIVFTDMRMNLRSPTGRLQFQILGAIAEFKASLIKNRVTEGYAWKRAFKKEEDQITKGLITAKKYEDKTPTDIIRLKEANGMSVGEIAASMIEQRLHPTRPAVEGNVRVYLRVSKSIQGCDAQEHAVQTWINNTPEIHERPMFIYRDEGRSAYTTDFNKRAGGKKLMAEAKAGDIIIVHRVDRMFRSLKDMTKVMDDLHKKGIYVWIIDCELRTDTMFGRMLVEMLGWVAQVESYELDVSSNTAVAFSYRTKGISASALPRFLRKGSKTKTSRQKGRWVTQDHLRPKEAEEFMEKWLKGMWDLQQRTGDVAGYLTLDMRLTNELFDKIGWPRVEMRSPVVEDGKWRKYLRPEELLERIDDMDRAEDHYSMKARRRRRAELRKAVLEYMEAGGAGKEMWRSLIPRRHARAIWQTVLKWSRHAGKSPEEIANLLRSGHVNGGEIPAMLLGK